MEPSRSIVMAVLAYVMLVVLINKYRVAYFYNTRTEYILFSRVVELTLTTGRTKFN